MSLTSHDKALVLGRAAEILAFGHGATTLDRALRAAATVAFFRPPCSFELDEVLEAFRYVFWKDGIVPTDFDASDLGWNEISWLLALAAAVLDYEWVQSELRRVYGSGEKLVNGELKNPAVARKMSPANHLARLRYA
jgi:hypothetical protein